LSLILGDEACLVKLSKCSPIEIETLDVNVLPHNGFFRYSCKTKEENATLLVNKLGPLKFTTTETAQYNTCSTVYVTSR